ncbi:MAG: hypothetical protein ACYDC3_00530 [Candidatus Binataceae bacterium]
MIALLMLARAALGGGTGILKLDVMGEIGADASNAAQVIAPDGKVAGEVHPGATLALAPGTYKLVLPIVGGNFTKDDVKIEAGRTHTVLITNVAVLQVVATDKQGKDPGFGVTVTASDPPHAKLASFLTGEKYLFEPQLVDVHVDAPPQGYDWHAVELRPAQRARLTLNQMAPAELNVQTTLQQLPIDSATRVIILRAGTQSRVAESAPGASHQFKLDPGDYDIYVENNSGKGRPTLLTPGIHLGSGATVAKTIPLD